MNRRLTLLVALVCASSAIAADAKIDEAFAKLTPAQLVEARQALLRRNADIEPNPRYETLMQGVEQARREGVDYLLAVGGGGYNRDNIARAWTSVVAAMVENTPGGSEP